MKKNPNVENELLKKINAKLSKRKKTTKRIGLVGGAFDLAHAIKREEKFSG